MNFIKHETKMKTVLFQIKLSIQLHSIHIRLCLICWSVFEQTNYERMPSSKKSQFMFKELVSACRCFDYKPYVTLFAAVFLFSDVGLA